MNHEPSRRNRAEPAAVMLLRAWWEAAGPALARAARPVGCTGGTLEVVVADRRWQRQIEQIRPILLARLRCRQEDLSSISISLDPAPLTPRREVEPRAMGPATPPEEILSAAQSIDDPDLKRRWCAVIGRHLQRRGDGGR